ncbi:MAG: dTDP-glucose 4,6-dehydratase [Planctomycetota bacterium]|nr:dTDP-glucose 4,6-dehydratase [Planctomycetota bacterium]
MSTILVTGGAGFIGSCFVRMAIERSDDEVLTLDKLTYAGCLGSLAPVADDPQHRFVEGDIADGALVLRLLEEHRPAAVVNFAAESHVDRSIDGPADFVATNVVGTFRLLEACLQYWSKLPAGLRDGFRFLQVSTDEVYGSLGAEGRFDESSRFAPNSPYSASKAAADHFARAYWKTHGLPVLATNSSNNYGPYQLPEKLVPLMILAALAGRELPVYGDGQHVRDWLYVEDNCRAIRAVLDDGQPGRVYNIGGDCERTNLAVVKAICRIVDRARPDPTNTPSSSQIRFVADRPGHDRRYAVDSARIRDELGWRPREEFESGLEKTVRWYLANSAWVEDAISRCGQSRQGLGG